MSKADRRGARTERALKGALVELLLRKDLGRITVSELAEAANVNRVTFYAHYVDIYDIYEHLSADAVELVGELAEQRPSGDYESLFSSVVGLMAENRWVYLLASRDATVRARLSEVLEGRYLSILSQDNPGLAVNDELRSLAAYHIAGLQAIVARWARGGYRGSTSTVVRRLVRADAVFEAGLHATGVLG